MIPLSATSNAGDLVTGPGLVQYGGILLGGPSAAGWADLTGWRDTPSVAISDTVRPQAHGAYPGDVFGESLTVTLVYRLDLRSYSGTPEEQAAARLADLRTLEAGLPLDGLERPLVVDDGAGPTMRMARVIGRRLPQDAEFLWRRVVEPSVQWLCADPRRYALTPTTAVVELGTSTGGLVYPLAYPLSYGTTVGGSRTVTNDGSTAAPVRATFVGPLTNPVLTSSTGWRLAWRLVLAAGETLVVDTAAGTALLNGDTDRLYTLDPTSSPLERCQLPPGPSTLSLAAAAGTGQASVTYRHAYL